jgi:hypothetical protein
MNNERSDQQELKVTISDKTKTGGLISLSISKFISPDADPLVSIELLTNELQSLVSKKVKEFEPKEAVQTIKAAFDVPQQNISNQSFQICEKCGAPKSKYVKAGVSKAGKPYNAFYGCSNKDCR